jgi:hypothetical protein
MTMEDDEEPRNSTPMTRLYPDQNTEKKVVLKACSAAVHYHLPPPLSKGGVADSIPKKSVVPRLKPLQSMYAHFLNHFQASGYDAFLFNAPKVFGWVTESLGNLLVATHVLEMFSNISACDASFWLLFVFKVGEQLETHKFDPLFGKMMALYMQFMQDADNQNLTQEMEQHEENPSIVFFTSMYDKVEADFASIPKKTSGKGGFDGFDTFKKSSSKSDAGSIAASPNPNAFRKYLDHHKGIFGFIYDVLCFAAENPDQMYAGLNPTEVYYLIRALFQSMTRSVNSTQGFGLSQLIPYLAAIPAEKLDLTRIYQRIMQMIFLTNPTSAREWADEWFNENSEGKMIFKSESSPQDALLDGLSRALAGNNIKLQEMNEWVASYFAVKNKKLLAQTSSRSQIASNAVTNGAERPVESMRRRTLQVAAPAAAPAAGGGGAAAVHTPMPARQAAGGGGGVRHQNPSHSQPVQPVVATKTKSERINENKGLLDAGIITDQDFNDAKAKILAE